MVQLYLLALVPTVILSSFVQGNEYVEEHGASRNLALAETTGSSSDTPATPTDDLMNNGTGKYHSSLKRKTIMKNNMGRVHNRWVLPRPHLRAFQKIILSANPHAFDPTFGARSRKKQRCERADAPSELEGNRLFICRISISIVDNHDDHADPNNFPRRGRRGAPR